jgi:hypothetical protein
MSRFDRVWSTIEVPLPRLLEALTPMIPKEEG